MTWFLFFTLFNVKRGSLTFRIRTMRFFSRSCPNKMPCMLRHNSRFSMMCISGIPSISNRNPESSMTCINWSWNALLTMGNHELSQTSTSKSLPSWKTFFQILNSRTIASKFCNRWRLWPKIQRQACKNSMTPFCSFCKNSKMSCLCTCFAECSKKTARNYGTSYLIIIWVIS